MSRWGSELSLMPELKVGSAESRIIYGGMLITSPCDCNIYLILSRFDQYCRSILLSITHILGRW